MTPTEQPQRDVDWRHRKVVAFDSDDWGGCGSEEFPDTSTRARALREPAIAEAYAPLIQWSWGTLESPEKMQRLFELLLGFKGADNRRPSSHRYTSRRIRIARP